MVPDVRIADAGLVISTSEGHKKFYTLRLDAVRATAQQLQAKDGGLRVPEGADTDEYDRKVLKDFFRSDGSLRQLPMQRKKFLAVLKHIVKDIEPGREYTEKQINALLERPPPRHGQPAQRHDRLPLDGAQVGRVLACVSGKTRAGPENSGRLLRITCIGSAARKSPLNHPAGCLGNELELARQGANGVGTTPMLAKGPRDRV